jgi:hypothetical protein
MGRHWPVGAGAARVFLAGGRVFFCLDRGALNDFSVDKPALLF